MLFNTICCFQSSPHCVFTENSVTLHFFCVTIHSSHTGYIDLYNNGLVACALTMNLYHQTNSNPKIFSLDKFETHIEPLLHKNLGIIFSPDALEVRVIRVIHHFAQRIYTITTTLCIIPVLKRDEFIVFTLNIVLKRKSLFSIML